MTFFREPQLFAALTKSVYRTLLENRLPESPIRLWIPGCATGEEVYSLAISLVEFLIAEGLDDFPVKIFATDVSAAAIERARAATYPESIERDVSQLRLQRFFFGKTNSTYKVGKRVRDLCIFALQDVTRDPPFAGIDLVSARNLTIEHGSASEDPVIPSLHYALKRPGFLLLDASQTGQTCRGFSIFDAKHHIYSRTPGDIRSRWRAAAPARKAREGCEFTAPGDRKSTAGRLRAELASARDHLQSLVEQLEANNEELAVTHEELVSSNQELRTTHDELQSAHEELQATN
jgi:two-component system CheB/CheR fusion protein